MLSAVPTAPRSPTRPFVAESSPRFTAPRSAPPAFQQAAVRMAVKLRVQPHQLDERALRHGGGDLRLIV